MKKYLLIVFTHLLFLVSFFAGFTHAQTSQNCAKVIDVRLIQPQPLALNSLFTCIVSVDNPTTEQRKNIACGISINGEYPSNFCPSQKTEDYNYFPGWRGNQAYFNCIAPYTDEIVNAQTLELVGDDFSEGCKQQSKFSIPLTVQRSVAKTSSNTSNKISDNATKFVEELIRMFGSSPNQSSISPAIPQPIRPTLPSPSPVSNVPSSNFKLSSGPQMVAQIVDDIKAACRGGVVNSSNASCIESVKSLSRGAKDILEESARTYDSGFDGLRGLQCVGFVKAMILQTTGILILQTGDAASQLYNQQNYRAVYKSQSTIKNIKPGDILIWTNGGPGHIVYVLDIVDNTDRNIVTVAEANWTPATVDRSRNVSLNDPDIAGWLTPQ